MQLDPNNDSSNPFLREPVLQIFIAQGDTVDEDKLPRPVL